MIISKLATQSYITSKHWEYRNGDNIKFIIPHHMAGKSTGANCAMYFVNNGMENSANYCIGYDGDIACNVPEEYGAWTSSFWAADKYGITMEVSDTAYGDWRIPVNAQEAMIKLMVDLIQRYPSLGGKAVFDPSDEARVVACKRAGAMITGVKGNILLHVWTSAYGTSCPNEHMISILPRICEEVNRRLGGDTPVKRTLREEAQYMIDNNINGKARINQCAEDGFSYDEVQMEIDRMLGKDIKENIQVMIDNLPAVELGDSGSIVEVLQAELKNMGYYTGAVDGEAGTATVEAIKAAQTNWNKVYKNYDIDGAFGTQCWTRLLTGK